MTYTWSINAEAGPSTRPREKKKKKLRMLPLTLGFLAPAFAAEEPRPSRPYPPPPRITRAPRQLMEEEDDGDPDSPLVYLTSVVAPTHLPTTTVTVDQTVLPYVLTQDSQGDWRRVNNAWSLYGREAGLRRDGVLVGGDDNFLVESSLPKGWGQQSSRTSFYKVPLIAICSVILAVFIVAGITIMAINRRKAHRKAKRRAERRRRKELAAAGLDENGINGTAAEAALKDKITELDEKHRTKKKRDGHVGFSRTKVKRWASGLRRRKGEPEQTIEVIQEEPPEEPPEDPPERVKSPSLHTISDVMAGDTTDSDTPDSSRPTEPSPETSQETMEGPYLPPEYRPASVHSAGESRPRRSSGDVTTDKTRAPGYYPAPATRDTEEAMEVVSRAEGKRPLPPPQEEVRHIATDDKRVLEQMRLGASAPPVVGESEAGPSAPHVEVDQDGFELADEIEVEPEVVPLHPDIPAPPQPTVQRAFSHLAPSAPPSSPPSSQIEVPSAPPAPSSQPSSPPVPSAPPLPEDEEDRQDTPEASAPTFVVDTVAEDGELASEQPAPEPGPRVFLPKYEP